MNEQLTVRSTFMMHMFFSCFSIYFDTHIADPHLPLNDLQNKCTKNTFIISFDAIKLLIFVLKALCKDLEREEVKKWLLQILEILMAERSKEERNDQNSRLDNLVKKHEDLIPTVLKTQVKVDLYWKCYAYGDELKPHIEFLDGIMISSTRDIAPSCVENVDELIERQEKALSQLEAKRLIVNDLIGKGKVLLDNPE